MEKQQPLYWPYMLAIVAAHGLAFWPMLRGEREFVNWDDPALFEQEDGWKGAGLAQLRWAFTSRLCAPDQSADCPPPAPPCTT